MMNKELITELIACSPENGLKVITKRFQLQEVASCQGVKDLMRFVVAIVGVHKKLIGEKNHNSQNLVTSQFKSTQNIFTGFSPPISNSVSSRYFNFKHS